MSRGKKYADNCSQFDKYKEYNLGEALDLLIGFNKANFDESVDISVNLGVDPKHADQIVRGTVSLPNGTGKKVRVVAITKDDSQIKASLEEGALEAGNDNILEKIKKGWVDFDILIASPDMMPQLSKFGRVLGDGSELVDGFVNIGLFVLTLFPFIESSI